MAGPRLVEQLVITTEDKPGMLSDVTEVIAGLKVNIEAICAYGMEGKAIFYIITRDNTNAKKALLSKGWQVKEDEVVVVDLENKPGALNKIAAKLKASGINLLYCYGSTGERDTFPCHFVFKAEDNKAAFAALK
ncbi:MAG: ACT domain-containing protein [Candidatus Omnitrophota bacterium]|nr:ACT domain-containing protein [Candidatus Omnitrophota bacterium]